PRPALFRDDRRLCLRLPPLVTTSLPVKGFGCTFGCTGPAAQGHRLGIAENSVGLPHIANPPLVTGLLALNARPFPSTIPTLPPPRPAAERKRPRRRPCVSWPLIANN